MRIVINLAIVAGLLVVSHMALTTGARMGGPLGGAALSSCGACH
jgi:hypothetical protein